MVQHISRRAFGATCQTPPLSWPSKIQTRPCCLLPCPKPRTRKCSSIFSDAPLAQHCMPNKSFLKALEDTNTAWLYPLISAAAPKGRYTRQSKEFAARPAASCLDLSGRSGTRTSGRSGTRTSGRSGYKHVENKIQKQIEQLIAAQVAANSTIEQLTSDKAAAEQAAVALEVELVNARAAASEANLSVKHAQEESASCRLRADDAERTRGARSP